MVVYSERESLLVYGEGKATANPSRRAVRSFHVQVGLATGRAVAEQCGLCYMTWILGGRQASQHLTQYLKVHVLARLLSH